MENKKAYSHVIWDWNGTLFNDVGWCVKVINKMLSARGIKTLKSVSEYYNAFCFPIINYYKNVGFDFSKEPFEKLAIEYISLYHSGKSGNCKLYKNTGLVLEALKENGVIQVVLSASETGNLLSQMGEFDINYYFDEILGLSDIYAKSKIDIGLDYMRRKNVARALLIGDTEHDLEVANALGVDCVLISSGHQSREKLLACNVPVAEDITQILEYFL